MNNSTIEILKEKFPDQEFLYQYADYGGKIHAFIIKCNSGEVLDKTWEEIRNVIGVYFQSKLESEFEIWNLYLFFVIQFNIDKVLKHKIEHDTVSSRKIVFNNTDNLDGSILIEHLLKEHITNNSLPISKDQEKKKQIFSKDKIISSIIEKFDVVKAQKNKQDLLEEVLNQIENKLSNEI